MQLKTTFRNKSLKNQYDIRWGWIFFSFKDIFHSFYLAQFFSVFHSTWTIDQINKILWFIPPIMLKVDTNQNFY